MDVTLKRDDEVAIPAPFDPIPFSIAPVGLEVSDQITQSEVNLLPAISNHVFNCLKNQSKVIEREVVEVGNIVKNIVSKCHF